MAAMILYLFAAQSYMSAVRVGAGASFASTVVMCCYWFLTLIGGIHFGSAIVEEKEEGTLALLRMTGASPFSILAGKSLPRLMVAVLFLFVVSPFLMLAITLGGVLPYGLISSIVSILCYAVMLSQLGLFASVISRNTTRAFTWTCVFWLLFELGHWWAGLASGMDRMIFGQSSVESVWRDFFQRASFWLSERSLVSNLSATLLSFDAADIWHPQMTYHLCVAAVFFCFSWLLFEPFTAASVTGETSSTTRSVLLTKTQLAPRVGSDAVMWKVWQYDSGGVLWLLMRAIVAPVVIFCLAWGVMFSIEDSFRMEGALGFSIFFGACFFFINLERLLGGVLNSEIHQKTLASLIMLPRSTYSTYLSLLLGLLPAIAAGAVAVLVFIVLSMVSFGVDGIDVIQIVSEPWVWHFVSWLALTASVGLLLTTYVRYGGVLLAVGLLWIVAPMFCGITFAVVGMSGVGGGSEEALRYLLPLFMTGIEALVCVVVHRAIVVRLQELASR